MTTSKKESMARVPLIQEQDHPEFAEVIEKYRAGRRGKLINIYRMLLNAPAAGRELVQSLQHGALEDHASTGGCARS